MKAGCVRFTAEWLRECQAQRQSDGQLKWIVFGGVLVRRDHPGSASKLSTRADPTTVSFANIFNLSVEPHWFRALMDFMQPGRHNAGDLCGPLPPTGFRDPGASSWSIDRA